MEYGVSQQLAGSGGAAEEQQAGNFATATARDGSPVCADRNTIKERGRAPA
jgi:hypothetical protein